LVDFQGGRSLGRLELRSVFGGRIASQKPFPLIIDDLDRIVVPPLGAVQRPLAGELANVRVAEIIEEDDLVPGIEVLLRIDILGMLDGIPGGRLHFRGAPGPLRCIGRGLVFGGPVRPLGGILSRAICASVLTGHGTYDRTLTDVSHDTLNRIAEPAGVADSEGEKDQRYCQNDSCHRTPPHSSLLSPSTRDRSGTTFTATLRDGQAEKRPVEAIPPEGVTRCDIEDHQFKNIRQEIFFNP
jgi:hypothetical protein